MQYLIKSALCLVLFYPFYKALLSRETFHRLNRLTLIGILLASVVLPTCRMQTEETYLLSRLYQQCEEWLTGETSAKGATVTLGDIGAVVVSDEVMEMELAPAPASTIGWRETIFLLYLGGIFLRLGKNIFSVGRLMHLLRGGRRVRTDNGHNLMLHAHPEIAPFSWMSYIVLSEKDYREHGPHILAHEEAHISNRHSWDLLLMEVCLLLQWFNPVVWLIRRELQCIHEYEADETALRQGINAKEYQLLIVKKAVGARLYSLANSLNHSSLKKRLTMMMKKKSNPWARVKYLYVLPLAAASVVAFARTETGVNNSSTVSADKSSEFSAYTEALSVKRTELPVDSQGKKEQVKDATRAKIRCRLVNADTGEPIYGANVVVRGTGRGTVSNQEGRFEIEVSSSKEVINVSYVGMSGASIKVADGYSPDVEHTIKLHPIELTPDMMVKNTSKESSPQVENEEEVFMVVENMPEYPGGMEELMKFLQQNTKYPAQAQKDSIQGRVIVQFVIDKTGKICNPVVKKSVSPELDAEALRVVNAMPDWKPGKQRGKPVNVKFTLPIQFRLQGKENVQPTPQVQVTSQGEYLYGHEGPMQKGSLDEVAGYIKAMREKSERAKEAPFFMVQLKVAKDAPQESIDRLKKTLRELQVQRLNFSWIHNEEVFMVVEEMPEYPGGPAEMMKFLQQNVKYPAQAHKDGVSGRVIVQFIVGKDGQLRDFEVKKSVSPELDEEALRVVKLMPKWTPGKQRGVAVDCQFTLPIEFRIQ